MQRLTARLIPMAAVLALFTAGTFYAQVHAASAKEVHAAKPDTPEIFCGHMKTG
jgi:hypothetical protein